MEEVVEFVGVQLMVRGTVSFVDTKVIVMAEPQDVYPEGISNVEDCCEVAGDLEIDRTTKRVKATPQIATI